MRRAERPLLQVPLSVLFGFIAILIVQVLVHQSLKNEKAFAYKPLTKPFSAAVYRGISMGSRQLTSYLLTMRLQLHDNQAGRHVRYETLNYPLLIEWLSMLGELNNESEYPMMLASRVYSETRNKKQLRLLLGYIDKTFQKNPQIHWRRQAEATVIAKHRLGDKKLALAMAKGLADQPESIKMPAWARDMRFLILGDLNEFESAIALIQALLQSGSIVDPDELRFLKEKLLMFQQKLSEYRQNLK